MLRLSYAYFGANEMPLLTTVLGVMCIYSLVCVCVFVLFMYECVYVFVYGCM